LSVNIRRGFNRIYIVLTVLWAGYCLFGFPWQARRDAADFFGKQTLVCYDAASTHPNERKSCLDEAQKIFQEEIAPWQWTNYYRANWTYIFVAIVLVPLVLYGICRGVAAVLEWIVRGFRT
jgi:hypothetical protein